MLKEKLENTWKRRAPSALRASGRPWLWPVLGGCAACAPDGFGVEMDRETNI